MLLLTGELYAQKSVLDIQINIINTSSTIGNVLEKIEKDTDITFSYSNTVVDSNEKVTLQQTKGTVQQILNQIFKNKNIKYVVKGNKILLVSISTSKKKATISGYVIDGNTGEKLIYATVFDNQTYKGTVTNAYGFFSLTLPVGKPEIIASYTGFNPVKSTIMLAKDTIINFDLKPEIELNEVIVKAAPTVLSTNIMSSTSVSIESLKKLPVMLGEGDVLKTIQLYPGIQSGAEGSSGLYVRGGSPDQNLILLDGVPVYTVSHLFGYFSVFNDDAINNMQMISGGFPARYGGRLSSVVDIRMKEGNNQKLSGAGSVGLLSSKITLEGPVFNQNTSFIVSARRTYIDLLIKPLINKTDAIDSEVQKFYFYDLNAKINHRFSHKSRLYFSAYKGRDVIESIWRENHRKETDNMNWGNISSALRWNYIIGKKMFCNLTGTFTKYNYDMKEVFTHRDFRYQQNYISEIKDLAAKIDFDYLPLPAHNIKFGAGYTKHQFRPGVNNYSYRYTESDIDIDTTLNNQTITTNETDAYIEDEIKIGLLSANFGLHYSSYEVEGELFSSFQPRALLSAKISDKLTLNGAFSSMTQYIHLLTTPTNGMPSDLWVPVTPNIEPINATQYAGGVNWQNKHWQVKTEFYYKFMENLIEFKEGESFVEPGTDWQRKVETGKGYSKGIELLVKKNTGNTTGWISYCLSKSDREFEHLNNGKAFPFKYDRRHDFSFVLSHKFNNSIDAGLIWTFSTGNAATLAMEKYQGVFTSSNWNSEADKDIEYFPSKNNYRTINYHRLDLNVNFYKKTNWGERTWSLGLFNVYNRRNAYMMFFNKEDSGEKKLKIMSIMPILPSIKYSFKF